MKRNHPCCVTICLLHTIQASKLSYSIFKIYLHLLLPNVLLIITKNTITPPPTTLNTSAHYLKKLLTTVGLTTNYLCYPTQNAIEAEKKQKSFKKPLKHNHTKMERQVVKKKKPYNQKKMKEKKKKMEIWSKLSHHHIRFRDHRSLSISSNDCKT